MKSGDILEISLGGELQDVIEELEREGVEFWEDAMAILDKVERSQERKCRIILLDAEALGFKGATAVNREIIKRGLGVGHKLCHPEVALHLRRWMKPGDGDDEIVNIAMKGIFIRRSSLCVLQLHNDGLTTLGEKTCAIVSAEGIANGRIRKAENQGRSPTDSLWAFELA